MPSAYICPSLTSTLEALIFLPFTITTADFASSILLYFNHSLKVTTIVTQKNRALKKPTSLLLDFLDFGSIILINTLLYWSYSFDILSQSFMEYISP